MKQNWICRTKDTCAEFHWDGSAFYLDALLLNGRNRCISSPITLPRRYRRGEGEESCFSWTLCREETNDDGFSILLNDTAADCSLRIACRGRTDLPGPIEYTAELINHHPETIRIWIDEVFSAVYAFDKPATAWRIAKEHWLAEGIESIIRNDFDPGPGIHRDLLTEGVRVTAETNTCQDFNAAGMIPMVYLEGEGYGAYLGFEWTSSNIHAAHTAGGVRVSIDLHEGFTTRLRSGYAFTVAPIYIGVFDGDVDDGSNIFKRWFYLTKSPKNIRENKNEPLTQCDDWNLPPEEIKERGIQSIKWDYGWWEHEDGIFADNLWRFNGGSWHLRDMKYSGLMHARGCESMQQFGSKLWDLGLNWTVYVLLHDAGKPQEGDDQLTSVGPTAHPEWFAMNRNIVGSNLADLGNEECVAYCKRKLHEFFINNNVGTWRSDFEPIASRSNQDNLHDPDGNDVQYWCSRGFYEIADYLIETIPGFRYESCSSSGSMKDFATFRRCTVMNNDDSADISSLRVTFYDASYCFPPAQLQSPTGLRSMLPENSSYPFMNPVMGMSALIMGAVMCGGTNDLQKEYLTLHNQYIKPLIRDANLYHILPRPDMVHWDGLQYGCDFIPESGVCGAAFLFKPTNTEGETKHIPVRGLNPDYLYSVEFKQRPEQNFTARGRDLMQYGYDFTIPEESGNDIALYVFVKENDA